MVGAGCVVKRSIPPYAVVVGAPARVVASKFTIEQILEHESVLYPPEERLSRDFLKELFRKYYEGKKSIGTSEMEEADKQELYRSRKKFSIIDYSNIQ